MKVTEKILRKKFAYYNDKYFHLPDIDYLIPTDIESLGQYAQIDGENGILINDMYDYSDDDINMLLLHEMCHYYLFHHKIIWDGNVKEKNPHGEEFIELATKIGDAEGYNILSGNIKYLNYLPSKHTPFYLVILFPNNDDKHINVAVLDKKVVSWYKTYFKNYFSDFETTYKKYMIKKTYNSIFDSFDVETTKGKINLSQMEIEIFNQYVLPSLM